MTNHLSSLTSWNAARPYNRILHRDLGDVLRGLDRKKNHSSLRLGDNLILVGHTTPSFRLGDNLVLVGHTTPSDRRCRSHWYKSSLADTDLLGGCHNPGLGSHCMHDLMKIDAQNGSVFVVRQYYETLCL